MKRGYLLCIVIIVLGFCLDSTVLAESDKPPKYSFAVLSDLHIHSGKKQNQEKLEKALNDLHELFPKLEAVVMNGDLTEGLPEDYELLTHIIQRVAHPAPVFYTIGNHEFYKAWVGAGGNWSPESFPNGESDLASLHRFLRWIKEPKVYYSRIINDQRFIFLGSEHYRQTNPDFREDASLSSEQLTWLKEQLEQAKQARQPSFIFLHQPLPETVSGTYTCCLNNRAVIQHKELRSILSTYPNVFFFSGHTHLQLNQPQTSIQAGFTAFNSSSVSEPWDEQQSGGKKWIEKAESEGLIVEIYDDQVVIRGRDFYRKRWIKEAEYKIPLDQPWYYFFKSLISFR